MFRIKMLNQKGDITSNDRKNVAKILQMDAELTVYIRDEIYFQADIAILEFYKALHMWIKQGMDGAFHYYSVEYADYEDGAILSLIPYNNLARIHSVWGNAKLYNVFDKVDLIGQFVALEQMLKKEIEETFGIVLKDFIKHIPLQLKES